MHQEITQPSRTGRNCQCGCVIRKHHLEGDRVAWACDGCGRYEAIQRKVPATTHGAPK